MRYQLDAPIISHEQIADCEYEITVEAPEAARDARPGQFVQVLYDQSYNPFTRRPFSVYRVDLARGTFSIVYLARGVFTLGMRRKRAGEVLSIIGPLGNSYLQDARPDCQHLLVAGGVGAPPLYFLASEMVRNGMDPRRITVINGARSENLLVAVRELNALGVDLRLVTNDGSAGATGLVTDLLASEIQIPQTYTVVYTCGPTPMLRAVSDMCMSAGVPCQVSVETMMPCGIGVCMGCVVKIRDAGEPDGFAMLRSCYDGPVFSAEDILWE